MCALTAQNLLPGEGRYIELVPRHVISKHGGGRIVEGQSFAVVRDPVAIGNARTRGGSVPGEDDVIAEIDRRQIGNFAIGRIQDGGVQLELFVDIGNPTFTEAFPRKHRDRPCAEHRPHRHFDGAGVRTGHNADPVRIGHLQHFAHQVDGKLQTRLADLGAVRAAQ